MMSCFPCSVLLCRAIACPEGAQTPLTWRPVSQRHQAQRRSGRQVQAAARRNATPPRKTKKAKRVELDEVAQFEQLMCDWDDAFVADCSNAKKAAEIAQLAELGYQEHGRGFVFVRSRLDKRARSTNSSSSSSSAPKGFGAAPKPAVSRGTPLPNNPELHLLSWTACFVPGSQLDNLGGLFTAQDGTLLPDSSSLLAGGDAGSASSSDVLAELQRVLRGQDLSQLRGYIGVSPPSASGEAAAEEVQMTGVWRYEPQSGEVVVLLSAKIDGKPAVGAELLVVAGQEDGGVKLELPDGWEELMAA